MFRWNATLITEEQINLRPLDSILESSCGEQFVNSTRRVATSQRYAKPSEPAVTFSGTLNETLRRSRGNLFGSIKN
jgi:hypothetical protein